nr:hypothetical protein [Tanacetum cinerariifolium]
MFLKEVTIFLFFPFLIPSKPGFEPTTSQLTADRSTTELLRNNGLKEANSRSLDQPMIEQKGVRHPHIQWEKGATKAKTLPAKNKGPTSHPRSYQKLRRRTGGREVRKARTLNSPQVGFEPTTSQLTADRSTTKLLRNNGLKEADSRSLDQPMIEQKGVRHPHILWEKGATKAETLPAKNKGPTSHPRS